MNKKITTIGIVGQGFVGTAVNEGLKLKTFSIVFLLLAM